jgi:soluble lytic murein transglycosylase-like protein
MDRSLLSHVKRPQTPWSRGALSAALTSVFLLTGFASSSGDKYLHSDARMPDQAEPTGSSISRTSRKVAAPPTQSAASSAAIAATQRPLPIIDWVSFNQRFDGAEDANPITAVASSVNQFLVEFDDGNAEAPKEAAGSANARREGTVRSPISVFAFDQRPALQVSDLATEPGADAGRSSTQPRADLISGIPEDYARLAVATAAEEGVDPNWVLSVMRAENADFDPMVTSSAGAIGLMQVMPRIGKAFGVNDLTDPQQNIRAGTRFLRVLIDKYRNPVLIASAYNAGEPIVDLRHSLPLNRETADYVTRVVGFYTGAAAISAGRHAGVTFGSEPGSSRRVGPADRAKSPMLVFSVADPLAPEGRPHLEERPTQVGGPVKIVKEEVH